MYFLFSQVTKKKELKKISLILTMSFSFIYESPEQKLVNHKFKITSKLLAYFFSFALFKA
jgi:hypothetical protein